MGFSIVILFIDSFDRPRNPLDKPAKHGTYPIKILHLYSSILEDAVKYLFLTIAVVAALSTNIFAQERSSKVRLVVQQNNQALVTEIRHLTLPKGEGSVLLTDLPATMEAHTLQVDSKSSPRALTIRDLSLENDLLTPTNLLRKHLGKEVMLILPDGKSRDGRVQKQATIMSTEEAPVFLVDGALYAGPYDAIIYPELPKSLSARPRIVMNVNNTGQVKQDIELSYIAREISWRMDYVLTMNKASTSGQLTGWVTIQNRSGADFTKAEVELLAGEPRSVQQFTPRTLFANQAKSAAISLESSSTPEELFEYHLYPLKRPVTLANQQSSQVQLLASGRLDVSKKLLGHANALPSGRDVDPIKERLDTIISFRNSEVMGLGVPLPKGIVRAFQSEGGSKHFLGEAPIDPAPAGEMVDLRLGQAFDVTVERVAMEFEKTGNNSYRCSWELRVKNAKKQKQRVVLQELIPGNWKVQDSTQKWTKRSSGVLEFALDVPAQTAQEPLVIKYTFTTDL